MTALVATDFGLSPQHDIEKREVSASSQTQHRLR